MQFFELLVQRSELCMNYFRCASYGVSFNICPFRVIISDNFKHQSVKKYSAMWIAQNLIHKFIFVQNCTEINYI